VKVPTVQNDEFILYLERLEQGVFIHCDVLVRWSKEVKRRLGNCFQKLIDEIGTPIYALHIPNDGKHKKFLGMFGFEYCDRVVGLDGNEYEIYVWR
jgi:hypothetical protein